MHMWACVYVCVGAVCIYIAPLYKLRESHCSLSGNTSKSVYVGSNSKDTNAGKSVHPLHTLMLVLFLLSTPHLFVSLFSVFHDIIYPTCALVFYILYLIPAPLNYYYKRINISIHQCMVLLPYMQPIKKDYLYVPPDDITTRVQRLGITLKKLFVCANNIIGVVLMQSLKEAVNVMVRWSNDDWATYHDAQADLITTSAHDEMELFQFNISAEKALHIRFALYYCTIHDGSRTFWDNNYGQNYNFELSN